MNSNYNFFLRVDVSRYVGKWIAIVDNEIVANGKNAKETYEKAKNKYPEKRPLLTRILDKETMVL